MPRRLTSTAGLASRCFSVGISVWPPPRACASSAFSAATASATRPGFTNSNAYIPPPPPRPPGGRSLLRRRDRRPDPGGAQRHVDMADIVPPDCSASITALTSAGGEPIAPASPQPLTPSGLCVQGVTQD